MGQAPGRPDGALNMARRPLRASDIPGAVARYLTLRSSARAHLRGLMLRKLDPDDADAQPALDAELDRMEARGLLGDAAYAASRARSMVGSGRSPIQTRAWLRQKGVAEAEVGVALREVAEDLQEDPTLAAARAWVRKKRAGHLSVKPDDSRDLARMGRAGFPYDVARRALRGD